MPSPDLGSPVVKRRSFVINTRRYWDVATYITLLGEFDQASAGELHARIRDAEETDVPEIVVDLADVYYIDSSSLRVLVLAKRRSNGRLRYIPSCHDEVTRLLQATGTLAMFD